MENVIQEFLLKNIWLIILSLSLGIVTGIIYPYISLKRKQTYKEIKTRVFIRVFLYFFVFCLASGIFKSYTLGIIFICLGVGNLISLGLWGLIFRLRTKNEH
jgi:cytochrome bd-type quinol oxidase subunit 1